MTIKKPRGTRDFAPDEMQKRDHIESLMKGVFEAYGYHKITTPTFEHVELFNMKSGEEIAEHMYVFEDKGGRKLCLRPEATASVCRMYSEELRSSKMPLRLYYSAPMFRYERPQKGRYREFWQLGVELIGPRTTQSDAEVILLAHDSLKKLNLDFSLEIGHMGILRGLMQDLSIPEELQNSLIACIDKGEEDSLAEYPVLKELIKLKGSSGIIPQAEEILSGNENAILALHELKEVLGWLDVVDAKYVLDLGIARGLEYYTGTVFEIRVEKLGAQKQICGGGRYDNLIGLFSGVNVPAVGFAFGFDRVANAAEAQGIEFKEDKLKLLIAAVNKESRKAAFSLASELRGEFAVELDIMERKLDKILKQAGETGICHVLLLGPRDLENNEVTLRDMVTGEQETIKRTELFTRLRALN